MPLSICRADAEHVVQAMGNLVANALNQRERSRSPWRERPELALAS